MKEKILALLGFPTSNSIEQNLLPWKDGTATVENALIVDGRNVSNATALKAVFDQLQVGVKKYKH